MARMKIYVNAWSVIPRGSSVEAGPVSVDNNDETSGRFGYALISIKNGNSPAKEYEFLADAFRGSSFRMTTNVNYFDIPDNAVLTQLDIYIVRLKILAQSPSVGNVEFDVRQTGGGRVYGPIIRHNLNLANTWGRYFEILGRCQENTATLDLRRLGI